ncbi:P-loop NTPase fold protein [Acinetobacter sp. 'aerobic (ED)']|uniref:P-loop NTPase fold protein n=1 Tax=Acinetobacter sp. 'aerobic (ED)' TaxID=174230 RepID=UPI00192C2813|nr:P-loop NTPase fold protein [Acinetobacter sp. 'aerobic (ED)']
MDILEKEQRLKQLLEHNIRNEKVGTAIAITGPWGVGKTFFWKKFLEKQLSEERIYKKDNLFNRKYAYVSLFGLESLSDLKTQIYSSVESYHSTVEIPKWIKGLPSIFKDTKISQFGINAPVKLFDGLMFAQIKDAIICFDDFERMSKKLDIKDVMGLANQLKLERNCQIILILDEDKAEDGNKQKYVEYKEKLVDETLIINSVTPLIRAKSVEVGIDEPLIELMIEFAETLDVHNFRFFQKVIKLYQQFRDELPLDIAQSTKEIILIRIIQGYLIHDFANFEYDWNDCQYYSDRDREHWSEIKQKKYEALKKISYDFIQNDLWFYEFKKWFEQKDRVDFQTLTELATSELISEEQNQLTKEIRQLMIQWRNIEIEKNFCERLHSCAIKKIGFESLENLDFSRVLLIKFGRADLSKDLKINIKHWIEARVQAKGKSFSEEVFGFGYKESNIFHRYIRILVKHNPLAGLPNLIEVVKQYVIHDTYNSETSALVLEQADKEDWHKLLFEVFNEDIDFKEINRLDFIKKIITQPIKPDLNPKIRQEILEILQEKATESELIKLNVDYIITRLND